MTNFNLCLHIKFPFEWIDTFHWDTLNGSKYNLSIVSNKYTFLIMKIIYKFSLKIINCGIQQFLRKNNECSKAMSLQFSVYLIYLFIYFSATDKHYFFTVERFCILLSLILTLKNRKKQKENKRIRTTWDFNCAFLNLWINS